MINVETDDYGEVEDRSCGCPVGELGCTRHILSDPQLREADE